MTNNKIDTAFVLAAGRGERLRPLTDKVPKPLLPIKDTTLIEYNLEKIKKAGIKRIVINVWHLGQMIIDKLGDGKKYGLDIQYSIEKELLGTGGGLKNAFHLIDRENFLLVNADIITDLNYVDLVDNYDDKSLAMLAVKKLEDGDKHTPILVDNSASIIKSIGTGDHHYMGISVLTKTIVDQLPEKYPSCLIKDSIIPLIQSGENISAYEYNGSWCDAGTIAEYNNISQ